MFQFWAFFSLAAWSSKIQDPLMIDDSRSTVFKWNSTDVIANGVWIKQGLQQGYSLAKDQPKISELLECFNVLRHIHQ